MSYAAVAGHNAPPPSQQPQPDTALLNTVEPTASSIADDSLKVNIVSPEFNDKPATVTSEADFVKQPKSSAYRDSPAPPSKKVSKDTRKDTHREEDSLGLWDKAATYLLRPGVAGGLVGITNVSLLAAAGCALYKQPNLLSDKRILSGLAATTLSVLLLEDYFFSNFSKTG